MRRYLRGVARGQLIPREELDALLELGARRKGLVAFAFGAQAVIPLAASAAATFLRA